MKLLKGLLMSILAAAAAPAAASYADDRAEIENLAAIYLQAMDARDMDAYVNTFTEDGVLDWVNGVEYGRAEIRDAIGNWGNPPNIAADATSRPRQRHNILNHVIFVDGDTATERAYWVAFTNQTPQRDVQVLYFGHYESELRRVDGRWLYSRRKIYNESLQNREAFYPALGERDPRAGAAQ